MEIDLGEGKVCTVREIDELRSGDRTAVNSVMRLRFDPETSEPSIPGDQADKMRKKLAERIIVSWNLQWPIPSKQPASLDKLTLSQEDALYKGLEAHFDAIKGVRQDDGSLDVDPTDSASSSDI